MTPRLALIIKREADLEAALRIVRQDRRDEDLYGNPIPSAAARAASHAFDEVSL